MRDRKHGLDHALDVGLDLVVPESQHREPESAQCRIAPLVVLALNVEAIVLAVHLADGQARRQARPTRPAARCNPALTTPSPILSPGRARAYPQGSRPVASGELYFE